MEHDTETVTLRRTLLGRRLLGPVQVAEAVGCSRQTVWRAVRSGELRAVRLGPKGAYRIALEDVDEWVRPADEATR